MIDKNIDLLCCPVCKSDLILKNDTLVCTSCNKVYNIIDDIPIMLSNLTEDVQLSLNKWNSEYENYIDYKKQYDVYKKKYMADTIKQIEMYYISQENDKYLEIGCGPMFLGTYFAKEGLDVIGIDISINVLLIAKKFYSDMGLECFFVCGDVNQLPLKDNLFGLIYGGGVIEHFKSTDLVLSETYRVARKGGICFNTVPYLNFGALTYRQIWGNIPNFPVLKQLAEYTHIKLLKSKYMRFGYELSFTRSKLEKLYDTAGYSNVSTHKFIVNLDLEYLHNRMLQKMARYLAENSSLFWPMIYVVGEK